MQYHCKLVIIFHFNLSVIISPRNEILNNNKVITNFDEDQLMDLVDVNTLNQQLNSKKESATSDSKQNMDSISEDDLLDEL